MHTYNHSDLKKIEHELAKNIPFGDPEYLNQCTWTRYEHRLAMISEHLPEAVDTLNALRNASAESKYAVIGDPVVRRGINQVIVNLQLHRPLESSLVRIIQLAGQQLRNNSVLAPLHVSAQRTPHLSDSQDSPWIWCGHENDASAEYFQELVKLHLAPSGLTLKPANDEIIQKLRKGMELLTILLPELAQSALSHTHLVAILDHQGSGFTAVTNPFIPGAIFLAESAISTPWNAAENLLHESLHAKFLDIEHTHTLMAPGWKESDCSVRPPWRRPQSGNSYLWPLTRVLTVTHVYTALSLFYATVELNAAVLTGKFGPTGEPNFGRLVRQSLDRAEYLTQQLEANQKHLGPAGMAFTKWLIHLSTAMDPSPRPTGSYLHHLADLYQQEANLLASRVAKLTPSDLQSKVNATQIGFHDSSLADVLQQMLKTEIASVRQIAEQAGHKLPWANTLAALVDEGKYSPAMLAANLWSVRALLCQSLLEISPARYTSSTDPLVMEDLLFNSSRHIEAALNTARV